MLLICENHKTCFQKHVCNHSKPHEFTTGKIGYLDNCQGKTHECKCTYKALRKEKLEKIFTNYL